MKRRASSFFFPSFCAGAAVFKQIKLNRAGDDGDFPAFRIPELASRCGMKNRGPILGRGVVEKKKAGLGRELALLALALLHISAGKVFVG